MVRQPLQARKLRLLEDGVVDDRLQSDGDDAGVAAPQTGSGFVLILIERDGGRRVAVVDIPRLAGKQAVNSDRAVLNRLVDVLVEGRDPAIRVAVGENGARQALLGHVERNLPGDLAVRDVDLLHGLRQLDLRLFGFRVGIWIRVGVRVGINHGHGAFRPALRATVDVGGILHLRVAGQTRSIDLSRVGDDVLVGLTLVLLRNGVGPGGIRLAVHLRPADGFVANGVAIGVVHGHGDTATRVLHDGLGFTGNHIVNRAASDRYLRVVVDGDRPQHRLGRAAARYHDAVALGEARRVVNRDLTVDDVFVRVAVALHAHLVVARGDVAAVAVLLDLSRIDAGRVVELDDLAVFHLGDPVLERIAARVAGHVHGALVRLRRDAIRIEAQRLTGNSVLHYDVLAKALRHDGNRVVHLTIAADPCRLRRGHVVRRVDCDILADAILEVQVVLVLVDRTREREVDLGIARSGQLAVVGIVRVELEVQHAAFDPVLVARHGGEDATVVHLDVERAALAVSRVETIRQAVAHNGAIVRELQARSLGECECERVGSARRDDVLALRVLRRVERGTRQEVGQVVARRRGIRDFA